MVDLTMAPRCGRMDHVSSLRAINSRSLMRTMLATPARITTIHALKSDAVATTWRQTHALLQAFGSAAG